MLHDSTISTYNIDLRLNLPEIFIEIQLQVNFRKSHKETLPDRSPFSFKNYPYKN